MLLNHAVSSCCFSAGSCLICSLVVGGFKPDRNASLRSASIRLYTHRTEPAYCRNCCSCVGVASSLNLKALRTIMRLLPDVALNHCCADVACRATKIRECPQRRELKQVRELLTQDTRRTPFESTDDFMRSFLRC